MTAPLLDPRERLIRALEMVMICGNPEGDDACETIAYVDRVASDDPEKMWEYAFGQHCDEFNAAWRAYYEWKPQPRYPLSGWMDDPASPTPSESAGRET